MVDARTSRPTATRPSDLLRSVAAVHCASRGAVRVACARSLGVSGFAVAGSELGGWAGVIKDERRGGLRLPP
jgi:hypothetical protein